jgi:hypothetical protein
MIELLENLLEADFNKVFQPTPRREWPSRIRLLSQNEKFDMVWNYLLKVYRRGFKEFFSLAEKWKIEKKGTGGLHPFLFAKQLEDRKVLHKFVEQEIFGEGLSESEFDSVFQPISSEEKWKRFAEELNNESLIRGLKEIEERGIEVIRVGRIFHHPRKVRERPYRVVEVTFVIPDEKLQSGAYHNIIRGTLEPLGFMIGGCTRCVVTPNEPGNYAIRVTKRRM